MLFDKIYVLSKAGQAIFGGRPQELSKYLIDCNIECTENQLPIEVLLKHSCNTRGDTTVKKMIQKTEESEKSRIDRHVNDIESVLGGIEILSKRFLIRDLWLLLLRALTYTYRYYWRLIIIQFFAFICCALSMRQFYTKDIGRPNGCWSFADGIPDICAKTKESIEEKVLISYNLSYNFFILTNLMFLSITASTVSFTSDLKMFINEQRNGMQYPNRF